MEQGAVKVGESRVKTLQSEVNGVKEIMTKNVERILERGERLDDLMGKTEDLQADQEKEAIKASETRVTTLQREVGGVVDIMTKNMERIVERIRDRGERLDHLMSKSKDLQADVQYFKHTPRNVTGSYSCWWKNVKMIICIVVVVVIIILIIILLATGVIPTSSSKPSP